MPNMNPSAPISRLLSLPYEIRMQIWQYAIPRDTELSICPCLHRPPLASETAACCCQDGNTLVTQEPLPNDNTLSLANHDRSSPTPIFLRGPEDLISELPLTCRQTLIDTQGIVQQPKHLTLCSPECLTSLLSALAPMQLAIISNITIAVDLRAFRAPPESGRLASFQAIWQHLHDERWETHRAIMKIYFASLMESLNAAIIKPELDFYPLGITPGRPYYYQNKKYARLLRDARNSGAGHDRLMKAMVESARKNKIWLGREPNMMLRLGP